MIPKEIIVIPKEKKCSRRIKQFQFEKNAEEEEQDFKDVEARAAIARA